MEKEVPEIKKINKNYVKFSRLKRKILKHTWLVRLGAVGGIAVGVYFLFLLTGLVFGKLGIVNYAGLLRDFVFTPGKKILSINGRTNILVLGKAGGEHEAPDLTDAIVFVSVSHVGGGITLVSLPRDIWIPAIRAKLNSAYYWGNQKEEGGGLILAKSAVEEIVGQPVHYGLVIDFSGFKSAVTVLGGIEVEVERAFIDERYPIAGKETDECDGDKDFKCRYETIRFAAGLQYMDGETALKFVRSRNAEGDEGTDIARAARQQRVILAIKNKVLSAEILLSPKKLSSLLRVARNSIETDIESSTSAILLRRLVQARETISSFVIGEDFLVNPPLLPRYDYLYVFIPKEEDWGKVHQWVKQTLP